jgi:lipopolysaccharide/colanic/teichoic acid biosynthesis glycosyltransferase
VLQVQLINCVLAGLFFYTIPLLGVAPKTILFIYLLVSSALLVIWRAYAFRFFRSKPESALIIGGGQEFKELVEEVNGNPIYSIRFNSIVDISSDRTIDVDAELLGPIDRHGITTIVLDIEHRRAETIVPRLYPLLFSGIKFVQLDRFYEDIFDRVPLSLLVHSWFLGKLPMDNRLGYDIVKRLIDITAGLILSAVSLLVYPFVIAAIKLDDGGPVFIKQERVGYGNKPFSILKFRTMSRNEDGVWLGESNNVVTRAGRFLRRSRIDELPQLFAVIAGNLSLVGPRPDLVGLEARLQDKIPYYRIRYLVKPGLSGWAQIKQEYSKGAISPQSLEETKERLAYDFYYIKNRSLLLDIGVAARTIKVLLTGSGS